MTSISNSPNVLALRVMDAVQSSALLNANQDEAARKPGQEAFSSIESPPVAGFDVNGMPKNEMFLSEFKWPWESSDARQQAKEILKQQDILSPDQVTELEGLLASMSDGEFADTIESMTPAQLRQYLAGMSENDLKAFSERVGENLSPKAREALFERMMDILDDDQTGVVGTALQGSEAIAEFTQAVIASGDAEKSLALLKSLAAAGGSEHDDNAIAQLLQHLVDRGRTDLVTSLLSELSSAEDARLLDGLARSNLSFEARDALFETLISILSPESITELLASASPQTAAHLVLAAQESPSLLNRLLVNMPTDLLEAALFAIGQGGRQGIHAPDQMQALTELFTAASGNGISADAKAELFSAAASQLQRMKENGLPMSPSEPGSFANNLLNGMTSLMKSDAYGVVDALVPPSSSKDEHFGYELKTYASTMLSMGRSAELAGLVESFSSSAKAAGESGSTAEEIASITGAFYGGLEAGYSDANAASKAAFEKDLSILGFLVGITPVPGDELLSLVATITIATAFEAAGYIEFPDIHGAAPSLEAFFDNYPDLEDNYDAAVGRVVTPETYGGNPEKDWPPGNRYLEGE